MFGRVKRLIGMLHQEVGVDIVCIAHLRGSPAAMTNLRAALDTAKTAVATPFATEQSVLANIGKTVKTQDDVVRGFAAK